MLPTHSLLIFQVLIDTKLQGSVFEKVKWIELASVNVLESTAE